MIGKPQSGPLSPGIVPSSATLRRFLSPANGRKGSRSGGRVEAGGAKKHDGRYRKILLFGNNRELALYRAEVLNYSGFTVSIPRTRQEAVDSIRRGDFDAAILSYTLSGDTVEELAELVRQHCPDCPLITISQERTRDPKIGPDATVLADDGPPALLSTLRRVLDKRLQ